MVTVMREGYSEGMGNLMKGVVRTENVVKKKDAEKEKERAFRKHERRNAPESNWHRMMDEK
jgi:hypothetical protein